MLVMAAAAASEVRAGWRYALRRWRKDTEKPGVNHALGLTNRLYLHALCWQRVWHQHRTPFMVTERTAAVNKLLRDDLKPTWGSVLHVLAFDVIHGSASLVSGDRSLP